jgi:hypothetical protein
MTGAACPHGRTPSNTISVYSTRHARVLDDPATQPSEPSTPKTPPPPFKPFPSRSPLSLQLAFIQDTRWDLYSICI